MTKRLCTFVGCRVVVDHPDDGTSPRCPAHPSTYKPKTSHTSSQDPTTLAKTHTPRRKRYEHQYDDQGRLIYKTAQWKRIRKARLLLNPLCQHCESVGLVKEAVHVDHIKEIQDGGRAYDINNTQSLCIPCHNKKTAKEQRKRNKPKSNYKSLSDF